MTIKKLTVIAAAGTVLLAGAIGISMRLTSPDEMEMNISETEQEAYESTEDGAQTLSDMENTPLYYDETEKLLLPLRNVMEGLGGSVKWNKEMRMTEVSYRGRTLALGAGEKQATLNGYTITLPEAAEIINGCLYADETLLTTYFTGDVQWHTESHQITLQAKDTALPVIAKRVITDMAEGSMYYLEVPVIVGLNDSNYEKNLNANILKEIQETGRTFLEEEREEAALLRLELYTGAITQNFLSLWWEGDKDGEALRLAKNIDLTAQKTITLADMLAADSLKEVRAQAGEGWQTDAFYLTEEGKLVLFKEGEIAFELDSAAAESEPLVWKEAFRALQEKK